MRQKEPTQLFPNKYGYFTPDGREYVITRPDTPRPWVNVLTNGTYGTILSQAGSGYSWYIHAAHNRITRWDQDLIKDISGKYLYLRDDETGEFWSLTWKPTTPALDFYECRHGVGYTVFSARRKGIAWRITIVVHPKDPVEIWTLEFENHSARARRLSVTSYLEWCLGEAPDWHHEFHKIFVETRLDPATRGILATKRLWTIPTKSAGSHWNRSWEYTAFHAASPRPSSFTADKEAFLGQYGTLLKPRALTEENLTGELGKWNDPIGSLRVPLALGAGGKKSLQFCLGLARTDAEARGLIRKSLRPGAGAQSVKGAASLWKPYLDGFQVQTPDPSINLLCNTWLKVQAIAGRLWGRNGYFQVGGAFGFRDQLQDAQVFLPLDPDGARRQILLHAAHQFKDGTVYHWWHPISEVGSHSRYSDDLLWLPFVVLNYLREVGGTSLLKERAPTVDGAAETVFQHCQRAIERALTRFSRRGLPLMLEADWNDGLNAVGHGGKGESIWMAHFLYGILCDWAELCDCLGKRTLARRLLKDARKLRESLNRFGWDGEWFLGATCDDGTLLGSRRSKEGKIFLNAQTWAVISDSTDEARKKTCMRSVRKHLDRRYGPLLLYPAYTKPDPKIGYVTRYAPGLRENGGLYTHAGCWAIWAACVRRDGDWAYQMYRNFSPVLRGKDPDFYTVEPYVTPGNVDGPDSPHFGRGGWTWYTGSAAWLFRVLSEQILGIRPVWDGLLIDPCVPKSWKKFSVRRKFRGAAYDISVENSRGVSTGVAAVWLDGKKLSGAVLPSPRDRKVHRVRVIMG